MNLKFLLLSVMLGSSLLPYSASAQFGGLLDGAANAVKSKVEKAKGTVSDVLDADKQQNAAVDVAQAKIESIASAALPAVDRHDYESALSISDEMCEEIIDPFRLSGNVAAIAEDVVMKDGVNLLRQMAENGAAAGSAQDLLATAKSRAKLLNWLPMEKEISYGRKVHEAVIASDKRVIARTGKGRVKKLYEDADALLARVMAQIPEEHPYELQLLLIDSNDINATALPGGFLHLYTGVLASDHGELVLAHELGHVFKRHQTRETQARLIDTVDSVDDLQQLLRNDSDVVDKTITRTAELYGSIQNYSRQQELQADACAVRMAGRIPAIGLDAMIDHYVESIAQTTVTQPQDLDRQSPADGVLSNLPIREQSGHPDYPERRQRMKDVAQQLVTPQN